MTAFDFAGVSLHADPSGALVWPERRVMVVADLHLEKGAWYAARGIPLPPYDTGETLDRLEVAIARHRPDRLVCLGDSVHDGEAARRMTPEVVRRILGLARGRDWIWIAGNHDPEPDTLPGGRSLPELAMAPLVFRHEAAPGPVNGEVSGHYHPRARIRLRGRTVSGRCFVLDRHRLILPAFGAYAGGLDVTADAFDALLQAEFEVLFPGPRRVYRFAGAALVRRGRG